MDAAFLLSKPVLFRTNEYLSSPTLHSPLSSIHFPQKKEIACLTISTFL